MFLYLHITVDFGCEAILKIYQTSAKTITYIERIIFGVHDIWQKIVYEKVGVDLK